jgi:hypothetical protein
MMAGPSSLGAKDVEPLAKKAHPWSSLPVSSWYGVVCWSAPLPFFLFLLYFKRWCRGDRSHTSSTPIVHRPAMRLVMPLYLPLVAFIPQGTLAPEVREAPSADGARHHQRRGGWGQRPAKQ